MQFAPVLTTLHSSRPLASQSGFRHKVIRDQFSIQAWLAFGAAIQALLLLLPIRSIFTVAPVCTFLIATAIDIATVTFNLKLNPYTVGLLPTKFTALVPNSDGNFGQQEGQDPPGTVTILLLGFRTSHPLGALAPGAGEVSSFFRAMVQDLHTKSPLNGFLGSTTYLSASDGRSTHSHVMTTFYFPSLADSDAFAHSPVHREGWKWWTRTHKLHGHLSIWHEVYEAPQGRFENVYDHCEPIGLAATTFQVTEKDGEKKWMSPIVHAEKGQLASGSGRCKAYD